MKRTIYFLLLWFPISIQGQVIIDSDTTFESVTYFMIDGLSQVHFEALLDEGRLPNIEQMLDEGIYVKNGIVSFPSMTGYAFYPFLTGMDAAESGILGLRWIDRKNEAAPFRNYVGRTNIYMNEDLRKDIKTVYEYFDDQYTASINTYCNRGVSESVKTGLAHVTSKYDTENAFGRIKDFPIIGNRLFKDLFEFEREVGDLAMDQLEKNPKVHWLTFAGPDARNHVHGTDDVYLETIVHIDGLIGEYIDKSNSLKHRRLFVLASDHGVRDVHSNIRVEELVYKKTGIKLHRGAAANMFSLSMNEPEDLYEDYDGKYVVNGNLCALIYLKGSDEWTEAHYENQLRQYKGVDIVESLTMIEGMELVIYRRSDDLIVVESKEGKGFIELKGDSISYSYTVYDPLGYALASNSKQFEYDQFYQVDSILSVTENTDYPNALDRIANYLIQESSPDIVLLSESGFDLAKDYEIFVGNYKGGHGGLHRDLISVPFIVSGNGIQKQSIPSLKSEDLGKMIFEFLGLQIF